MQRLFALLLVGSAAFGARDKERLEACRLDTQRNLVSCRVYAGKSRTSEYRRRALRGVDGWVAIPCKQLKVRITEIECRKGIGEMVLGEPFNQ